MGGAALKAEITAGPDDARALQLQAAPHVGDLLCPHCNSETFRRTSRGLTPTFREIFYACRNMACGHTFKASLNYDYGISPSGIPNPDVDLPMRPMERIPGLTVAATGPPQDPNQPNLFD